MCATIPETPPPPCRPGWLVVRDPFAPRKVLFCYDPGTGRIAVVRKGVERFVDLARVLTTRHP